MPASPTPTDSKIKSLAVAGLLLIVASIGLWPSPERALIERLIELEGAMNESPAAFAESAAASLSDPLTLRVQGHFEDELSPGEAAERWQQFYQLYGPVIVELDQLEATLDPPVVKGKVLVSSQPRDLHARAHAFTAALVRVGEEHWKVDELTLYQAPEHLPEARP